MFDGIKSYMAVEYELLSMVNDFSKAGLILALKPPLMVRKGLIMLKKLNCQVLHQSAEQTIPIPKQPSKKALPPSS